MRVAIYPDIPQLTDVDDDFHCGEPVDHRPLDEILDIHAPSSSVVQSIQESWLMNHGDKIVLEMEDHDFVSLCAFGAVLRPEAA